MVITFEYDPVQTWQHMLLCKISLKDGGIPAFADEETFETSNHAVAVNFKTH